MGVPAAGTGRNEMFTISGSATDNQGVNIVRVAIKEEGGFWWNTTNTAFDGGSEDWMNATAVDGYGDTSEDWYLDVDGINFNTNEEYRIRPEAADISDPAKVESAYNDLLFTYDVSYPTAVILSPNTTTHLWVIVPTISGTAEDTSPGEVDKVEVLVKRDAGPGYWNPPDTWGGVNWIEVDYSTATDYWVYDTTVPAWADNYTYTLQVRSTDDSLPGGNQVVDVSSSTFQYDPLEPISGVEKPSVEYYSSLPTISGTSEDTLNVTEEGSGLVKAEIRIMDMTLGTTYWQDDFDYWKPIDKWKDLSESNPDWTFDAVSGDWTFYEMTDGDWTSGHEYWINIRAYDEAGNYEVGYSTKMFTFDTEEPTSGITTPPDATTVSSTLDTISGTADDGGLSGVDYTRIRISSGPTYGSYWNGSSWVGVSTYVVTSSLNAGATEWGYDTTAAGFWASNREYMVEIKAYDKIANEQLSVSTVTYTYDITDPTVEITIPDTADGKYSVMNTIEGTAYDQFGVSITSVSIEQDGTDWYWDVTINTWTYDAVNVIFSTASYSGGDWDIDTSLINWANNVRYVIKAKAVDGAGNETDEGNWASTSFYYDGEVP